MIPVTQGHFSENFKQIEGLFYTEISNESIGLASNTDLIAGKYEGGLKLWECSLDLIRYLKAYSIFPMKVLELGCGHGLPGIFCAKNGSEVTFQDYNKEVIEYVTINNVQKNITNHNCSFFYGPWGNSQVLGKFDLVIMSETIYNPENYSALLQTILDSGAKECIVACKNYYFGVGGGAEIFAKAAENQGFSWQVVDRIEEIASIRVIIKLINNQIH